MPLGIIGIIFESRPNVTVDAATLCLKAGNAVILRGGKEADELLQQLPGMEHARISHCALPDVPELEVQGIYGEVIMEKQQWKSRIKDQVKQILKEKPEPENV